MESQQTTTVTSDDGRRPSMAVVDLVATATGTDPLELEPLYNAVDPDALDSLCSSGSGLATLEFVYAGHTVVVSQSDGGIDISLEPVTIGGDAGPVVDTGGSA